MRTPRSLATLPAFSTLHRLIQPCSGCRQGSSLARPWTPPTGGAAKRPLRLLSSSAARLKSKTIRAGDAELKIKTERNKDKASPDVLKSGIFIDFEAEKACDPEQVNALWTSVDEHFRATIKTVLRHATFDHAWIEELRVRADTAEDAEKQRRKPTATSPSEDAPIFKLREVAEVVPREGRNVAILVNEAAWVRPVRHALTRRMNRTPQSVPANPLELAVQLERKRPEEVAHTIKVTTQSWRDQVRQRRTKYEQLVKEWARKKELLVDEMRRAQKMLQERQDAKMKMITEEHNKAIKALHGLPGTK